MSRTRLAAALLAGVCFLPAATLARVTSIAGFTEVRIDQYRNGSIIDTVIATDRFPETDSELPLQVAGFLSTPVGGGDGSGGAAAAQFADPTDSLIANPEEFAINLAAQSVSPEVYYDISAVTRESRGVIFDEQELGAVANQGDPVDLSGSVFIDGALAMLAVGADADLSESEVTLHFTVRKIPGTGEGTVVFNGTVTLSGTTGGGTNVSVGGDFPSGQIIQSNLGALAGEFGVFRVVIIPNIRIDYDFTASFAEQCTLEATVEVTARNQPGDTGVVAVIGSPTDAIPQVLDLTQGTATSLKVLDLIQSERENPTGDLAFPTANLPFGLCGGLGFSSLAGLMFALVRLGGTPRSRRRGRES